MKRSTILGLALLVAGALVFSIGYFGSGQNVSAMNGDLGPFAVRVGSRRGFGSGGTLLSDSGDKEYKLFSGGITYIELDEINAGVVVTQSSDSDIHLIYQESGDDPMEISNNTGKLTMKRKTCNGIFFLWGSWTEDRRTELQLPHGITAEVAVHSDNGSVTVKKAVIHGDAEFSGGNGNVEVQTLFADKVTLKNTNGAITAKDVHCADATLQNSNGKIEAEDFDCASLEARSSNGRVTLTDVSAETSLYAKTSNGAVTVDNVAAGKRIELRSSNGSVRGTLAGSGDDYRIESKTSNGSNNLPGSWGKGDILLTVETSNGNIDLTFKED